MHASVFKAAELAPVSAQHLKLGWKTCWIPALVVVPHKNNNASDPKRQFFWRPMCIAVLLMLASKADDGWMEDGVRCHLYASGVVKYGINLGWPKSMERTTRRNFTKDAVTAVRTHKGSPNALPTLPLLLPHLSRRQVFRHCWCNIFSVKPMLSTQHRS